MDKKLHAYIEYISKASDKPTAELIDYHKTMTAQFQHERFIHLIVTLFFALFMIIFFIFFAVLEIWAPLMGVWNDVFAYCVGGIDAILLITTLFYVRHYYILENGVEELEEITRKLYKRNK